MLHQVAFVPQVGADANCVQSQTMQGGGRPVALTGMVNPHMGTVFPAGTTLTVSPPVDPSPQPSSQQTRFTNQTQAQSDPATGNYVSVSTILRGGDESDDESLAPTRSAYDIAMEVARTRASAPPKRLLTVDATQVGVLPNINRGSVVSGNDNATSRDSFFTVFRIDKTWKRSALQIAETLKRMGGVVWVLKWGSHKYVTSIKIDSIINPDMLRKIAVLCFEKLRSNTKWYSSIEGKLFILQGRDSAVFSAMRVTSADVATVISAYVQIGKGVGSSNPIQAVNVPDDTAISPSFRGISELGQNFILALIQSLHITGAILHSTSDCITDGDVRKHKSNIVMSLKTVDTLRDTYALGERGGELINE